VQAYVWISLGAVFGAALRYAVSRWIARITTPAFPFGTLLINVTGSLLLGFFLVWTSERVLADSRWRLCVAIGFCGSYTTFSSYAFECIAYLEQGHWSLLATNIVTNNMLSLAAVVLGAALARWL